MLNFLLGGYYITTLKYPKPKGIYIKFVALSIFRYNFRSFV